MADFFVSYTSSDRDWAGWLGKELQALGHEPHIHEWELESGGDIYSWMETRLDAADHVLCVVSDEYLKAPYSTLERNAALWQAASSRPGFVLMVVVKPARLPTLSDHLRRCELYGVSDDEARKRFRDFLTKRSAPDVAFYPGQAFAISNIPLHVPTHFTGRDDVMSAIEPALHGQSGGVNAVALFGLRGVGKTTVAAAYAEQHRSDYRATWWIRAQSDAGIRADLVALGVRLHWASADDQEDVALSAVMQRLQQEGDGFLLIFDNAIDSKSLRPFLPRGGRAHILVTSNTHAWRDVAVPFQIGVWGKETGADYLVARTGRNGERAAAELLSETLGGLPLAHEQAAAYCERLEKSLVDYHKRFTATPIKLLDDARDAPAEYHDRLTVTKTFAVAIDEAAKLHAAAEPLITHLALLAPESLPIFLFEDGREKFGEPLAAELADDGLDEALAALRAFALIERHTIIDERRPEIATDTIKLHRLIRQVAAERLPEPARGHATSALIDVFATVYPDQIFDPETWPRARRLDAAALALLNGAPPDVAEEAASRLLSGLAGYRHRALGAYAEARALYERALALCEKRFGANDPRTAETLNNLALVVRDEGDSGSAKKLLERALAINEQAFGDEHIQTVVSLNNLALLLRDDGDLEAAIPLLERTIACAEKAFGPEHPTTAASMANLALALKSNGDLTKARALLERALAIDEKSQGADHPDVANDLDNLALLSKQSGDLPGARALYQRALAIKEKSLGLMHPATADSLIDLAKLVHDQGELETARDMLEKAAAVLQATVGPDARETADCLSSLATVLHDQGDLAQALKHYERALAINEKKAGADSTATAVSLNNLADLLREQGDLTRAQPLLERAVAVAETRLGADDPYTSRFRANLANVLLLSGQSEQALKLAEAARAALETHGGGGVHRWITDAAGIAAGALDALGRAAEATALRERYSLSSETMAGKPAAVTN
jgi:tetratricopeptide (TPR) repeat protein